MIAHHSSSRHPGTQTVRLNDFTGRTLRAVLCFLYTTALLATVVQPARAAVTEAWVRSYNGPASGHDVPTALAVDRAGNVVVAGYSDGADGKPDFYTAKYSGSNGAVLWEQRHSGGPDAYEYATAMAVDRQGNVVVTGFSGASSYTAKYAAADGALLWENIVDDPLVQLNGVAVDHRGNVVVAGSFHVAMYSAADGRLLWQQFYDGYPMAVAVDARGSAIVTGYSDRENNDLDYSTAKYAAKDGRLLWEQHYNGPTGGEDEALALAVDEQGNVVVTGYSHGGESSFDYYTTKYAAKDGAVLWGRRYNGPDNSLDVARAVSVDRKGNVAVTGWSNNGNEYPEYYTAKYAAADGAVVWENRYEGIDGSGGEASAVAVDVWGNVVVTGSSYGSAGYPNFYTAKYSAAHGTLLWEERSNNSASWAYAGAVRGLALGPNGLVAITGTTASEPNGEINITTIAYRESRPKFPGKKDNKQEPRWSDKPSTKE
jgi:PQQ-like domain